MNETEKSFEELFNESISNSKLNEVVTGTVIAITQSDEIFVDIGYKADGIIPKKEYSLDENANPRDEFKVGDEITALVLKQNDGQGNVLLSYARLKQREKRKAIEEGLKELEKRVKENEIFEEEVKQVNDKGLIIEVSGQRVFIPLSLSGIPKGEDASRLEGQVVKFRITEFDVKANRIIGSIKSVINEELNEKQDKFWESVKEGKKYLGKVVSISSYGAFVELEGAVQGLLHVSEISWDRNAKAADLLKQGQEIEVTVKEIDTENKRLKLGYDKGPNPLDTLIEKYNINDIVKVKVSKFMPFGVFVELEPGIEGLVHISEIAEKNITKPEDELKIGQHVNAKIIDIDKEKKKIGLSIRELEGTSNEYKEEM